MRIYERLSEIWSQDYINTLPILIRDRGFCYSENKMQKDILITGINPSFNDEESGNISFSFNDIIFDRVPKSRYWSPIKKMIYDIGIDLRDETAYLDIFYFREKEQAFLRKYILTNPNGIQFIAEQIYLTQQIIEKVIKPKIIIVANKESSAYWGKFVEKGIIWMGYRMELVKNMDCGELFRIVGLIDSQERVSPELKDTNLMNSYILFSQHINQFITTEKRPKAKFLKELLESI
ncbi:MAG: hypothetical protein ACRCZY_08045 [Phocaeicola sp.]